MGYKRIPAPDYEACKRDNAASTPGTGTAGAATATRAAVAGRQYFITAISAGYISATQTGSFDVKDTAGSPATIRGADAVVADGKTVNFDPALPVTPELGYNAVLTAGGVGVVGDIVVHDFWVPVFKTEIQS